MKTITVELTNDQFEILEHVSKMCEKNTPELIKEALLCLIPLNEYIGVKNHLIELRDKNNPTARKTIQNINDSTNRRLKRIGIL
jgi:hypothetical protein